ncbi:MAG: polyphosphate polymerase domain-containing protein [Lachnospiraceae bacterium]|nr:polyphosphate polymerase domain-containing protein [Lachnospiraceae bacterium]
MAFLQIFERYEKKYLLNAEQEARFLKAVEGKMIMDQYGEHTICNIYFDDDNFELIRESLEKPLYKEKLRLRTYGVPENGDHQAFVEIKKKYKGVVYKRRIPLKLKEAESYLYDGVRPKKDSQILKEIDWFLQVHAPVKPKVVLTYVRRAFYGAENKDFRMTIDRDITCRYDDLHLTSGVHGKKLLKEGQSLLEIKIPGVMPLWMSKILSELKIYPASFSKYGTYYSITPELYMTASENSHKLAK